MIRYHLDENVETSVAEGLRRRGVDVTVASEVGLQGADDRAQLAFAHSEGRVLVTHDHDFLRLDAEAVPHTGIAYCTHQARSVGEMIMALALLHEVYTEDELRGRVEFL